MVVILGFLGGSFFKMDILSEWLGRLGEWIPNGAALTAYLGAMQGSSPARPDRAPDGADWMDGGFPPGGGRLQTGKGEGPMRAILWAEFRQVLRRPTMYLLIFF